MEGRERECWKDRGLTCTRPLSNEKRSEATSRLEDIYSSVSEVISASW
jgi:hypothetical protein